MSSARFHRAWLLVLLVLVMGLFLWMVRLFFVPVVLAAVVVVLAWPLQARLVQLVRGHRGWAALMSCLLIVVGVLGPLYTTGERVAAEAVGLYALGRPHLTASIGRLEAALSDVVERGVEGPLGPLIPPALVERLTQEEVDWAAQVRDGLARSGNLAADLLNATSRNTVQLLGNVFVLLFTMFYFFRDGEVIVARLKYLSPLDDHYERLLTERLVSISRATLRGSLALGLIQGGLGAATLALCGVRAPFLWGVVMVVLSIVPLAGTWMVMYPVALVQLALGNYWQAAVILGVTAVLITNIDNVLRPRLIGRGSGLHDLVIFFATIGGLAMYGAMGFIVGPVIAALFVALLDIYALEFKGQLDPPAKEADDGVGGAGSVVVEGVAEGVE